LEAEAKLTRDEVTIPQLRLCASLTHIPRPYLEISGWWAVKRALLGSTYQLMRMTGGFLSRRIDEA